MLFFPASREPPSSLLAASPAQVRLSTTLPVCCGQTRAEATRRAEALGEHGPRMLRLGVTGVPADVTARLAGLA